MELVQMIKCFWLDNAPMLLVMPRSPLDADQQTAVHLAV